MTDDMFGPYRLRDLLGQGGMGEVWRALDTRKDRVIALKVLGTWLGGDAEFVRRFHREAALAARLNAPNIVPIHDYGEIDGRLFIDMPLIQGIDLAALVGRDGPLPPERAVRIITQAGRALTAAHAAGLIHRDVKPSNILVTDTGGDDHVYLIDFGISREVDGSRLSLSGAVIGTPAYMAPERFAGEGDHRVDVYALGCVLYEALTTTPPYPATNPLVLMNAHLNTPPPQPSAVRPDVPAGMDDVIARGMAKNPSQRYSSADDLAAAARAALERPPATGAPLPGSMAAPRDPPPGHKSPVAALSPTAADTSRAPGSVGVVASDPLTVGLEPESGSPARRRLGLGPLAAVLGVLVLLALGIVLARGLVLQQYYVGVSQERVAIYQGVRGSVLGIPLQRVAETTDIGLDDLPPTVRGQILDGVVSNDGENGAHGTVTRVRERMLPLCSTLTTTPLPGTNCRLTG